MCFAKEKNKPFLVRNKTFQQFQSHLYIWLERKTEYFQTDLEWSISAYIIRLIIVYKRTNKQEAARHIFSYRNTNVGSQISLPLDYFINRFDVATLFLLLQVM